MKVSDLQQKIAGHQEALAALNGRVDQVLARVEALTLKAHELLAKYQEKKREAAEALGTAGRQFLLAERAFRRADDLLTDLTAIKDTHIALSHMANRLLAQGDFAEARQVLHDLMKIRRALRATCRRIERCRNDGLAGPARRTAPQAV
jgi:chromosome segregation ATPase